MTKRFESQSQIPAGAEPYGMVHGLQVRAIQPRHIVAGIEPAPPSGVEFKKNTFLCSILTDDSGKQCGAPRAKGTDYCIGHLNAINKAIRLAEEAKQKDKKEVDSEIVEVQIDESESTDNL